MKRECDHEVDWRWHKLCPNSLINQNFIFSSFFLCSHVYCKFDGIYIIISITYHCVYFVVLQPPLYTPSPKAIEALGWQEYELWGYSHELCDCKLHWKGTYKGEVLLVCYLYPSQKHQCKNEAAKNKQGSAEKDVKLKGTAKASCCWWNSNFR